MHAKAVSKIGHESDVEFWMGIWEIWEKGNGKEKCCNYTIISELKIKKSNVCTLHHCLWYYKLPSFSQPETKQSEARGIGSCTLSTIIPTKSIFK